MTKNYILTLDKDFSQMSVGNIYLNRGKIDRFYKKYEGLIRIFKRELKAIQEEYFVFEDGKIKVDKDTPVGLVIKEGKTMDEYADTYNKWASKKS